MELTDPEVLAVLQAAFALRRDLLTVRAPVFRHAHAQAVSAALGAPAAALLPGPFYPVARPEDAFFLQLGDSIPAGFPRGVSVVYADVRLAAEPRFAAALKAAGTAALLLPYADCADPAEPGYKTSYTAILDLRDACARPGVAALFYGVPRARLLDAYFDPACTVALNAGCGAAAESLRAESEQSRIRYLEAQCLRRPGERTAVLFPTRRHAALFAARFPAGGAVAVHGGNPYEENLKRLRAFTRGRVPVLCATKHVFPSLPFLAADSVYYAGLPFSVPFLKSCGALSSGGPCLCVYTAEDAALNARLAASAAETLGFDRRAFAVARARKLSESLAFLNVII